MQIIQTTNNKRIHSSSPLSPRRANPYSPLHNKRLLLKDEKGSPFDINCVNARPTEIRKIKTTYALATRHEKSFENQVEDPTQLAMNRFGKKVESFHSLSPKEKVDFPGPGSYFPCYAQTKNKALAFTFSSSEKFKTIMKSDTPDKIGPGSYNLCIHRKIADQKLSPSFLNKKRILFEDPMRKNDPEQPGPGEYYPERFFGAFKKTKNSRFQMFNSSSERFHMEAKTNVGPGTYMITKKTELKNDMGVREYSPNLLDPVKLFKDQNFEEQFPIKKFKTKRIHQKKKSGIVAEAISKKNNKFQNLNFDMKGKKTFKLPEDDKMFFINLNK